MAKRGSDTPVDSTPETVSAVDTPAEAKPVELSKIHPGDTIKVNKLAFYKMYNALLRNKPQFYVGPGALRILRECLGISGKELDDVHTHIKTHHLSS